MMRGVCSTGLIIVLWVFLFAGQGTAQPTDDYFVSKEQLKELMECPDVTIIDMRFGRDWYDSKLKIKGAVREDPMKPGQWLDKYPKDKMIVFY